jgi:AcrR family transcriptional regulator
MPGSPKPGRPRRADVEPAVVDATLRLLTEVGYAALSLDAVARSAGVSRPTLYRRWPSKAALVVDVLTRAAAPLERYHSGDLRSDVRSTYLGLLKGFSTATDVIPALLVLVGEAQHDAELRQRFLESYLLPRSAPAIELLSGGIATGELRGDLSAHVMHQMITGSLFFSSITLSTPLPDEVADQVFDALWDGLTGPRGRSQHAQ